MLKMNEVMNYVGEVYKGSVCKKVQPWYKPYEVPRALEGLYKRGKYDLQILTDNIPVRTYRSYVPIDGGNVVYDVA